MTTRSLLATVAPAMAAMSVAINVLVLASPLYMLQVFDRVISGRSVETLLYLSLIVLVALAAFGGLDACRAVVLTRLANWVETRLGPDVMAASVDLAARPGVPASTQPLNDLSTVRQFVGSPGTAALFDAPWVPIFVVVIALIHPMLGLVALISALLLFAMALAGELLTRRTMATAAEEAARGDTLLQAVTANVDVVRSMGLQDGLTRRWETVRARQNGLLVHVTERVAMLSSASKALRLAVQAAILGAGAFLVLERSLSPGEMIAASIILSRALAPIEIALSSWRQFVAARHAWKRLTILLARTRGAADKQALPRPSGRMHVQNVALTTAAKTPPILQGISFGVEPGEVLGIVGPSGSGKSSLGRLLVGAWHPSGGTVRLDGAELAHWDPTALGRHIGYLPQSVDLFPGTVQDNIARFSDASLQDVIAAAELAGAHDMIQHLPDGYATPVGNRGERLSGGQRQGVALARAVFGDPSVVVLDEPDLNLDQTGHGRLTACLAGLRKQGVTVVLIAHRQRALGGCDRLLWLEGGQARAFGPAETVLRHIEKTGQAPLRPVPSQGDRQ